MQVTRPYESCFIDVYASLLRCCFFFLASSSFPILPIVHILCYSLSSALRGLSSSPFMQQAFSSSLWFLIFFVVHWLDAFLFSFEIMVRTRDLGWALGRAIGKALGKREVSGDDNDVPNGKSLSHFPVEVRVVEDAPTVAEELNEEQKQPPVEEGVTNVEGFPDKPHDRSVLRDFENCEHPELKLSSHGRKMTKFVRPTPEIEGLVAASGLSPLITYSLDTGN
ncbi:hypothetical protein HKD37_11G032236 [Glycine soja]